MNENSILEQQYMGSRTLADQAVPWWLSSTAPAEPEPLQIQDDTPQTVESEGVSDPTSTSGPLVSQQHLTTEPTEFTCDRCDCTEYRDVPIHGGRSIRRDCAACGRTAGFPQWNPEL